MRLPLLLLLLAVLCCASAAAESSPPYAVATGPTPVLNTPDFPAVFGGKDGASLRLDRCRQMRELEFVALPGTLFRVEEVIPAAPAPIYRVTTADYPYPTTTGYFIDSRFVTPADQPPPPRPCRLPSRQAVIDSLLAARGSRYVWGGNCRYGVPQLLSFYSPAPDTTLAPDTKARWQLAGVDCSGLLYEATDGFTPRNTSALATFGRPVAIAGLRPAQIASRIEPLDLIVWPGHVIIVLDRERVIESRLECKTGQGVVVRPLLRALSELIAARIPLDDFDRGAAGRKGFVIRRWHPGP